MHVLMPETTSGSAALVAEDLVAAGHVVHACHTEPDRGFACTALRGHDCPLEHEPIDLCVDVRGRTVPEPTSMEDSVLCAIRRKIPLLVAGEVTASPWGEWAALTVEGTDVLAAVGELEGRPLPEHTSAGDAALRLALDIAGIPAEGAYTEVHRRFGRLEVRIFLPPGTGRGVGHRAAVRVARAVQVVDPYAPQLDVSIAAAGTE